ncbi:hypothetical protein cand_013630 [Cryptosporidium andersoni]|uniref:Uncharacterized protein n=1 Tax=Cryptosporidium andersoni TaxID=117008 RepID=A0A1J4MUV4_9CRYT|nr:hypothetical protein cand_013630 [Cryptosporidium andersoni]
MLENRSHCLLIAGTYDGYIVGLEIKNNQELQQNNIPNLYLHPIFAFKAHSSSIRDISANEHFLLTASSDETMRIYNLITRCDSGILTKHQGNINKIILSPKSKYMISCGEDKLICLWNCINWQPLLELSKIHKFNPISVDFHPSMRLALSIDQYGTICLIDLIKGCCSLTTTAHILGPNIPNTTHKSKYGFINRINFNQDGYLYAIISQFNIIVYSLIESDKCVNLFVIPSKLTITAFSWISNNFIIVGFSDGSIKFFYVTLNEFLEIKIIFNYSKFENNIPNLHRIKGVIPIYIAENIVYNGFLGICDSNGLFILFSYIIDQDYPHFILNLKCYDSYNFDTRITCLCTSSNYLNIIYENKKKKIKNKNIKKKIKKD